MLAPSPSDGPKEAIQAEDDEITVSTRETGAQGFELALTAEALLFASFQLVADAIAENFVEPLGGIDAETKDQDLLAGLPVVEDFVNDGGEFRVFGIMALVDHVEQDVEIAAGFVGFVERPLDATALGTGVKSGVTAGEVAAERGAALAAFHPGDAAHEQI